MVKRDIRELPGRKFEDTAEAMHPVEIIQKKVRICNLIPRSLLIHLLCQLKKPFLLCGLYCSDIPSDNGECCRHTRATSRREFGARKFKAEAMHVEIKKRHFNFKAAFFVDLFTCRHKRAFRSVLFWYPEWHWYPRVEWSHIRGDFVHVVMYP